MSDAVLHFAGDVPEAALLDRSSRQLQSLTDAHDGVWFDAASLDPAQPSAWPSRNGAGILAQAVFPDEFAADRIAPFAGLPALNLVAGRNCGFRLANAVAPASDWMLAILWHPGPDDAEIGTLLAVRGDRGENCVILAGSSSGGLELRDNNTTVSITLDRPGPGWQMALIGCRKGVLTLTDPLAGVCAKAGHAITIPAAIDLLIGCRAARRGMPRSLGSARIGGVWLWRAEIDEQDVIRALAEYWFWEGV